MTNTRLEHGKVKQSVIGRRGFLRRMGLVAVGSVVSRLGAASEELASSKPNIIVILTDDQGWADVGAQGRSVTSGRRSLTGSPPAGYDAPPGTSPRRSAARRVPFVVSWPGKLPAGRTYSLPVSSLDIAPTALAAAGMAGPARLDGVDLLPFLTSRKTEPPHEALYWRFWNQAAIRAGRWKYLCLGRSAEFLFDLESDAH